MKTKSAAIDKIKVPKSTLTVKSMKKNSCDGIEANQKNAATVY
jgi:hypothetical protein